MSSQTGEKSLDNAGRPHDRDVRMPSVFVGHGSPMNTIQDNDFTRRLTAWGRELPRPKAILAISAHWQTPGQTCVDVQPHPPTIHDFYNFPPAMYQLQYPAPGAPEIAHTVAATIRSRKVVPNAEWGLDHGTWAVLRFMFPEADIPVFQLSIDYSAPGEVHYALGRELSALRDQGIMILGSGNVTHNLRDIDRGLPELPRASQSWAQSFDDSVRQALLQRDDKALMQYERLPGAEIAVATPDHYWPLLYVLGAAGVDEQPAFTYESFQAGTLSMRCVQFG